MRSGLYTKFVLTLIAVMQTLMACKSAVQPLGVVAEGPPAGVQFSGSLGGFLDLRHAKRPDMDISRQSLGIHGQKDRKR